MMVILADMGGLFENLFFGYARFIMLGEDIVVRRLYGRYVRIAFKYILSAKIGMLLFS